MLKNCTIGEWWLPLLTEILIYVWWLMQKFWLIMRDFCIIFWNNDVFVANISGAVPSIIIEVSFLETTDSLRCWSRSQGWTTQWCVRKLNEHILQFPVKRISWSGKYHHHPDPENLRLPGTLRDPLSPLHRSSTEALAKSSYQAPV